MAENSKIEWCDATFNCWRGCTRVSAGCKNCYAETLSGRNPKTLGVWGPSGTRVVASESMWREPLKWNRLAGEGKLPDGSPNVDGHRPRVFCASLADVFEDWTGPMSDSHGNAVTIGGDRQWVFEGGHIPGDRPLTMDDVRRRLFELIDGTPNLDWLLVTKRPESILNYALRSQSEWWYASLLTMPANVWLGTSVENQAAADERIPHLLRVPAAVRFLSCEPLLGAVSLHGHLPNPRCESCYYDGNPHDPSANATFVGGKCPRCGAAASRFDRPAVSWVIVGGESGHGARPCNVEWVRSIVGQCQAAGVPAFVKQLGSNPSGRSPTLSGPLDDAMIHDPDGILRIRDKKGGDIAEFPDDLRVRDFPTPTEA